MTPFISTVTGAHLANMARDYRYPQFQISRHIPKGDVGLVCVGGVFQPSCLDSWCLPKKSTRWMNSASKNDQQNQIQFVQFHLITRLVSEKCGWLDRALAYWHIQLWVYFTSVASRKWTMLPVLSAAHPWLYWCKYRPVTTDSTPIPANTTNPASTKNLSQNKKHIATGGFCC